MDLRYLFGVNMMFKKEGPYAAAVATEKGLFDKNGAAMLVMKLSKAECDEFNGVKKSVKKKSKKS